MIKFDIGGGIHQISSETRQYYFQQTQQCVIQNRTRLGRPFYKTNEHRTFLDELRIDRVRLAIDKE